MPPISTFYGITVMMYWMDNKQHHSPHFHVKYAEHKASIAIATGNVLDGHLPRKKLKLVQAWMDLHQDELIANWEAASEGKPTNAIEPLR